LLTHTKPHTLHSNKRDLWTHKKRPCSTQNKLISLISKKDLCCWHTQSRIHLATSADSGPYREAYKRDPGTHKKRPCNAETYFVIIQKNIYVLLMYKMTHLSFTAPTSADAVPYREAYKRAVWTHKRDFVIPKKNSWSSKRDLCCWRTKRQILTCFDVIQKRSMLLT